MRLESLTAPDLIFRDFPARDRDAVLRLFSHRLAERGLIRDADELYEKLAEREALGSTGIGAGVAIPHCKLEGLERPVLAIGLVAPPGVDFGAVDGQPVRLFFLVVSPNEAPAEHLQVLAALSRWIKVEAHTAAILKSQDPASIYGLLQEAG